MVGRLGVSDCRKQSCLFTKEPQPQAGHSLNSLLPLHRSRPIAADLAMQSMLNPLVDARDIFSTTGLDGEEPQHPSACDRVLISDDLDERLILLPIRPSDPWNLLKYRTGRRKAAASGCT